MLKKLVLSLVMVILVTIPVVFMLTTNAAPLAGYSNLTAMANNMYVSTNNVGGNSLIANKSTAGDWESFKIINNSDGTISLLSQGNNMYVCADLNNGAMLTANRASASTWEKFKLVDQGNGKIALLAMANNMYVCADGGGSSALVANRSAVSTWEQFVITNFNETTTPTVTVSPSTATPTISNAPSGPIDFGPNVIIFDPSMSATSIQNKCDTIFSEQKSSQFGSNRYAIFFKPGSYNTNVNVGFYTSIYGLGQRPDDVNVTGSIRAEADWMGGNATCNFWRSVENLTDTPTYSASPMAPSGTETWAVSQAAPMRRVHIKGNLTLWDPNPDNYDGSWSSGGFISDSLIDNTISSASQQQYFTRNSKMGSWNGANWNMVFVGDNGSPASSWPNPPYTVVDQSPVIAEKPFMYIDDAGNYSVFVPAIKNNSQGITWTNGMGDGKSIPISQFYIAKPTDTADSINLALSQGKNLLFTPGIYHLSAPIQVTTANTVILGLGYATLLPDNGTAAMTVADVDGVRIAGLLFDAGITNSPVLLEVGPSGSSTSHASNPTVLSDIFCRVGGAAVGKATTCIIINSNDVIGDNFWLWRADHGAGVGWNVNTTTNGMIVNGNNVTTYGMFVEHFHQYQTVWNGNGGRTYFYQSECPYDAPNQAAWMNNSVNGYASYKVADSVTTHEAWGLGIYCVYTVDLSIKCNSSIEAPSGVPGVKLHHMVTVSLGGQGEITHVINNSGGPSNKSTNVATVAEFP